MDVASGRRPNTHRTGQLLEGEGIATPYITWKALRAEGLVPKY